MSKLFLIVSNSSSIDPGKNVNSSPAFLPDQQRPGEVDAGVPGRVEHGAGSARDRVAKHGARADGAPP